MSNRRLSIEREEAILEDLKLHERYTQKAIAKRHGVSRWTLWRLAEKQRLQPDVAEHRGNTR